MKQPVASYRCLTASRCLWIIPVLLHGMIAMAGAQSAITITGTHSLTFGSISRSGASSVGYDDNDGACFTVTGDTARGVRITVIVADLAAQSGASINLLDRSMAATISNSDCAFSLDGGATWNTLSTGTLYQDTRFPSGNSSSSSIYIRIGGSIAARPAQQRGGYSGTITVTAQYQ